MSRTLYLRGAIQRSRLDGPSFLVPDQIEVIDVPLRAKVHTDETGLTVELDEKKMAALPVVARHPVGRGVGVTKVFTGPDPKPERRKGNSPRRIIDPAAVRRAKLRWRYCAACGRYANNGHHVLPKDHHPPGDDVEANIVGLCGSGTGRCHGAFHGSPYTDEAGERWTQEDVARAIGVELLSRRRDVIDYLFRKLGERADWFLLATYYVTVPE